MPFLLTEYGTAFQSFAGDVIQALVPTHSELLRGITIESSGAFGSVFQGSDGHDVHLEPTSVKAEHAVAIEAVQSCQVQVLFEQLDSTAKQIAEGQEAALVATLLQVTDATGNVTDASGRISFDAFLESLEKMQWSLTDDDQLSLPSVLHHPDDAGKFSPRTEEQIARFEALKLRKHNELLAQRRNRRLS